ncbi:MAG: ABC transporter ATP-binding protein [Candidatus Rifleibacteriota bacterium]
MKTHISFDQVCKTFARRGGVIRALDGLDMQVDAQAIYGLAGINGAGKTTAIRAMLDFSRPDSGAIKIFDESPDQVTSARIGFAPENPELPGYLRVGETLEYSCALLEKELSNERLKELLVQFGLEEYADQNVASLSKGNAQRLSLAAAVAHEPELLIFDEPTSGLDPLGRKLVKNLIKQQKAAGRTVFFTTHILSDLMEICDCIGIIHQGKICFAGTPEKFCPKGAQVEERFSQIIGQSERAGKKT